MSDLALVWDNAAQAADLAIEANDLLGADDLEAAVLMSLLTNRRADDSDTLPDSQTDRQGWWADQFAPVLGDKFGSRLWLLSREKDTRDIPVKAETYAREALDWMVEDKVATAINVTAVSQRKGDGTSWLVLTIEIQQPDSGAVSYRYGYNWAAQAAKRV